MNNIDRLIAELCPKGVEHLAIGEFCVLRRGESVTKNSTNPGPIPVIAGGQQPAYFIDKANRSGETIVVSSSGAYAGFVSYWDIPIFVSDAFSIEAKSDFCLKYLYYVLKNRQESIHSLKKGGGVPHVHVSDLAPMIIPLPPLPVQEEIVRILDTFSSTVAELEQKLNAERAARIRQYEYYRDSLFTVDQNSTQKTLGDVGRVCMCRRIFKEQTDSSGDVPFFKIGTFGKEPDAYISKEVFEEYKSNFSYPKKGDVLFSAAGTIGRTVIFDGSPAYFQDSNIVWIDNDETLVLNKYLYYFYSLGNWATSVGGTISRLYNDSITKTPISVPPLEVQERIISILDRFDALVNDLKTGLPAEIALRRKQYEHYRDTLLTFPQTN